MRVNAYWGMPSFLLKTRAIPSYALAIVLSGYYTFATLVNALAENGSTGSIVIRAVIVIFAIAAITVNGRKIPVRTFQLLIPFALFSTIYGVQLLRNIFILNIHIPPSTLFVLTSYFISSLLVSILVSFSAHRFTDESFTFATLGLLFVFIVGLAMNWQELNSQLDRRLSLEKINPISMGHLAFQFIIFLIISYVLTGRFKLLSIILIPVLAFIVVQSQSRGAYFAGTITLLIFMLSHVNSKRMVVVTLAAFVIILMSTDQINVVLERFGQTNATTDISTSTRLLAFNGAWTQFSESPIFGRYAIEMPNPELPSQSFS